jgi:hypothetical protein
MRDFFEVPSDGFEGTEGSEPFESGEVDFQGSELNDMITEAMFEDLALEETKLKRCA